MPNVAAGNYFLLVVTDDHGTSAGNGLVFEANESNNVLAIALTLTTIDLVPTALGPASGVSGQPATATWTVQNQGTGASPGQNAWTDRVYFSTDATLSADDTSLSAVGNPQGLGVKVVERVDETAQLRRFFLSAELKGPERHAERPRPHGLQPPVSLPRPAPLSAGA
jgi:hypothetical protein